MILPRNTALLASALSGIMLLGGCAAGAPFGPPAANDGRYAGVHYAPAKYASLDDRLRGRKTLSHQVPAPRPGPLAFQRWQDTEPGYRLYPGDQIDIVVGSAPELSRSLTVNPDGRINLPMTSPVMAAGRTVPQVQAALRAELARQLRDPGVAVTPRAFVPQQVFVGGEVGQPGAYSLPGPTGVLETVFQAGGLRPGSRASEVAVLRRAPDGGMMMRVVDLRGGLNNVREYNDNIQLRRGDIVFVPRTSLAEVGVFVQSVRNALPVDFNLSYQFGSNNGGTTVISP